MVLVDYFTYIYKIALFCTTYYFYQKVYLQTFKSAKVLIKVINSPPLPSLTLWGGGGGKPEQTFMLFANNFALSTCLPILVCGGRRGDRGKLMFDIFPPKPLTKGEKAKISSPEIGGPVETMDIQFTRPYTIIKSI